MTRLAFVLVVVGCGRIDFAATSDAAAVVVDSQAVTVPAVANIWGAGHATPPAPAGNGAGVLPTRIALPPGSGRRFRLANVAGTISYGPGLPESSADGVARSTTLPPYSFDGLSSPSVLRGRYIAAVYLGDAEPADPAPPSLTLDASAERYAGIDLHQIFFTGDGLTGVGSGEVQRFEIPDSATRLAFGFDDGPTDTSLPGSYADNTGMIDATVVIEQ